MNMLKNRTFKNAKHWQDNFVGIFLIAATMFIIVIAANKHFPSSGTSSLLWLLGAIGITSLIGWTWLAVNIGAKTAERVLFKTH